MRIRVLSMWFAGCVLVALAGPGGVAPTGPGHQPVNGAQRVSHSEVSTLNWSGYAVYGASFQHAQGDWIQPSIASGTCPKQKTQLAAFFVGIDGYNSNSVEQIGTEADCVKGSPIYFAWYEMYPAPPITLACTVAPGNSIHAEVQHVSGSNFELTLTVDGTDCSPANPVSAPGTPALSSAEWIAEAPATGGHFWPLADFDRITFSGASATSNGAPAAISSWTNDRITMVNRGRPFAPTVKAQPGTLNGTGNGFAIDWQHS